MKRLVLLPLLLAALVLGTSAPASAASLGELQYGTVTSVSNYPSGGDISIRTSYGIGRFLTLGDKLLVTDTLADSRSVGLQWKTGSRTGICVSSKAASTTTLYVCDQSMPTYQTVYARVGRCDNRVYTCKYTEGWTDWSAWASVYNYRS